MNDRDKVIDAARKYIGKTGKYVCIDKLQIGCIVDWCAYAVCSIFKDCGYIGKYIKSVTGGAGDIPRQSDGKCGDWFIKGAKCPAPGDLVFFRYDKYPNQDKYFCDHVGIVENLSAGVLTTLEGNVDGRSGVWAITSTFKRKKRDLTDSSVYAFYRPKWAAAPSESTEPTVEYQANALTIWQPYVDGLSDYAGIAGRAIYGIRIKKSNVGHIRYRVHVVGKGWLPWVRDDEDYAGRIYKDIPIDGVQAHLDSDKYIIKYRVSAKDCDYYDWISDYSGDPETGYAGEYGKPIDRLQMFIAKK